MLLMERNRRMNRARTQSENIIQEGVQRHLRWMQIRLMAHLRRLARGKRRMNSLKLERLRKQQGYTPSLDQLWTEFQRRLTVSLHSQFQESARLMIGVEEAYFEDMSVEELDLQGFRIPVLDPADIVRLSEAQLDQLVSSLTTETRAWVGNQAADWYLTPGATLQQLTDRLDQKFNEVRSSLIGVNEVTALNSTIVREVMHQLGITEWFWQTAQDEIVCTRTLLGPDGHDYEGCADLQGEVFTIDMPMPPDASHIGCRCSAIYQLKKKPQGSHLVDLIPDLSMA